MYYFDHNGCIYSGLLKSFSRMADLTICRIQILTTTIASFLGYNYVLYCIVSTVLLWVVKIYLTDFSVHTQLPGYPVRYETKKVLDALGKI